MGNTTISISHELLAKLKERKLYEKESYEEVIWEALEDASEISEQTKVEMNQARSDIRAGKYKTLAQLNHKYGEK